MVGGARRRPQRRALFVGAGWQDDVFEDECRLTGDLHAG